MNLYLERKIKKYWEPGTVMRYEPSGIKSVILVSKTGKITYQKKRIPVFINTKNRHKRQTACKR